MRDDYGVTYAVYDRDRIPQLMRSPGPVSGGTQREMTMTRVPDDLARDLVEWAADKENAVKPNSAYWRCQFCKTLWSGPLIDFGPDKHGPDCEHARALYWLGAEAMQRPDRAPDEAGPGMRAVEVTYRYDGKLTHAGEGDDE